MLFWAHGEAYLDFSGNVSSVLFIVALIWKFSFDKFEHVGSLRKALHETLKILKFLRNIASYFLSFINYFTEDNSL